jgi:DNA-binding GntR family transcriptional regulator
MVMNVDASDQPREAVNELTTTLQDQAYEFVKGRIMNLDLKPGEYITDSQVVKEMEVSRTPVRDALRRLEQEGLLIDQGRRGWKVYALSLQDIHDIFDLIQRNHFHLKRLFRPNILDFLHYSVFRHNSPAFSDISISHT